jgi:hypothetical protein
MCGIEGASGGGENNWWAATVTRGWWAIKDKRADLAGVICGSGGIFWNAEMRDGVFGITVVDSLVS